MLPAVGQAGKLQGIHRLLHARRGRRPRRRGAGRQGNGKGERDYGEAAPPAGDQNAHAMFFRERNQRVCLEYPMQNLALRVLLLCLFCAPALASLPDDDDLDAVLLRNVRSGFVDYDGIRADPAFGRFVAGLATTEEADLERPGTRLAFLINAYNTLAIRGILDGYSPSSWFGRRTYFKGRKYELLGGRTTLEQLEHGRILPMGEPRVHFAIVCASISCPRLANRSYDPATLDAQLEDAARSFANDATRNRYDVKRRIAFLSGIFDWYEADFVRAAGSTQKYLARYVSDPAAAELLARDGFDVRFVDYDWELNGVYRGKPD
jgi:hypothetical protein